MKNSIPFEIQMSKIVLSNLFEDALDNAVSSEPMEVNSVVVKLDRIGEAMIIPDGKKINIELPLSIHLSRSAGLFTVEATGSIVLSLRVNADISPQLQLSTKTELISHKWIDKPVLEIGAINVPIETLVNLVLNHYESIITAKIDDSLKKIANLNVPLIAGLNNARKDIAAQDLKGNSIVFDIKDISLYPMTTSGDDIQINGAVTPTIAINQLIEYSDAYAFSWLAGDAMAMQNEIKVPVSIPYDFIENEIRENLKGIDIGGRQFSVVTCSVRGGEKLEISMEIDEPIRALVAITGRPQFDTQAGILNVDSLDVKVNPANFIYKLTAPLVNRFVEGKMKDFFPLKINETLNALIAKNLPEELDSKMANVRIAQSGVLIQDVIFGLNAITGLAILKDLDIRIKLKEQEENITTTSSEPSE